MISLIRMSVIIFVESHNELFDNYVCNILCIIRVISLFVQPLYVLGTVSSGTTESEKKC